RWADGRGPHSIAHVSTRPDRRRIYLLGAILSLAALGKSTESTEFTFADRLRAFAGLSGSDKGELILRWGGVASSARNKSLVKIRNRDTRASSHDRRGPAPRHRDSCLPRGRLTQFDFDLRIACRKSFANSLRNNDRGRSLVS